jgi:hypothetical protein
VLFGLWFESHTQLGCLLLTLSKIPLLTLSPIRYPEGCLPIRDALAKLINPSNRRLVRRKCKCGNECLMLLDGIIARASTRLDIETCFSFYKAVITGIQRTSLL